MKMKRKRGRPHKVDFNQAELTQRFCDVQRCLSFLYDLKNTKYENSFNKEHKDYSDAHYNIKRKYARLDLMAKRGVFTEEEKTDLCAELVDMANYSIMCIMKFGPEKFKTFDGFLDWLKERI